MTTFTARTPTDLLALVPVVIGFHPEDSVVLLTFNRPVAGRSDRAEATPDSFQARIDLPVIDHDQRLVAEMLREVVARHRVHVVALVLYTDDAEVATSFVGHLVPDLLTDGVEVIDVLRADGDRFYCVADAADTGVAYDLKSHPLTATGVLQGRVVHESRDAVRDTLIGSDHDDVQAVAREAEAFMDSLAAGGHDPESVPELLGDVARWLQRTIAAHLERPDGLTTADAGRLVVLLALDQVREVAWSDMNRANAVAYVEFLRALIRRTPADLVAGVAGLLGLASWLAGDGALAWCALDRGLASSPDDSLAQHIAALLESATPPSVWAPIPAEQLPIFADLPRNRSGFQSGSPLGSTHGSRR